MGPKGPASVLAIQERGSRIKKSVTPKGVADFFFTPWFFSPHSHAALHGKGAQDGGDDGGNDLKNLFDVIPFDFHNFKELNLLILLLKERGLRAVSTGRVQGRCLNHVEHRSTPGVPSPFPSDTHCQLSGVRLNLSQIRRLHCHRRCCHPVPYLSLILCPTLSLMECFHPVIPCRSKSCRQLPHPFSCSSSP